MKICITSSGENLDSPVNPRFGRCPYFLIVDTETREVQPLANTGVQAARGAGIAAAQTVAEVGCAAVDARAVSGLSGTAVCKIRGPQMTRELARIAVISQDATVSDQGPFWHHVSQNTLEIGLII